MLMAKNYSKTNTYECSGMYTCTHTCTVNRDAEMRIRTKNNIRKPKHREGQIRRPLSPLLLVLVFRRRCLGRCHCNNPMNILLNKSYLKIIISFGFFVFLCFFFICSICVLIMFSQKPHHFQNEFYLRILIRSPKTSFAQGFSVVAITPY